VCDLGNGYAPARPPFRGCRQLRGCRQPLVACRPATGKGSGTTASPMPVGDPRIDGRHGELLRFRVALSSVRLGEPRSCATASSQCAAWMTP